MASCPAGFTGANPAGRNKRTVWNLATQPLPFQHYASFPEALVEPLVLCSTSERGCCPECGAPWERVVEKDESLAESRRGTPGYQSGCLKTGSRFASETPGYSAQRTTTGWKPTCRHAHSEHELIPATVLDPFAGSGTTLRVAMRLGRRSIGIDLNGEYLDILRKRTAQGGLGL